MSLADIAPAPRRRPGPPCAVAALRARLAPADQERLDLMIADKANWTNGGLSHALAERGYELTEWSIGAHRRRLIPGASKQCACPR